MVRLKADNGLNRPLQIHISIPYGSIKSSSPHLNIINIVLFQFLMVRLKAVIAFLLDTFDAFQFLMVRLKVNYMTNFNKCYGFQFLMVRLKG